MAALSFEACRAFVARWCHGFHELAGRAADFTPPVAEGYTGVPAEQIVAAARMYADGPSTFVSGHGIDAFSAGVQTFRAFHCLVAISGNVGRPGGNLRMRTPKGFRTYGELLHRPEFRLDAAMEKRAIGADRFPLWAGPKGWQTACHNPSVIEAMLTGRPYPVRALYVSGVNILVTYPDTRRTIEALRSLDFVTVAAHAMMPTAEQADIVLPKTTTFEEEVSFMPSGPTVLFTRALVPPQGEARSISMPRLAMMGRTIQRRGRAISADCGAACGPFPERKTVDVPRRGVGGKVLAGRFRADKRRKVGARLGNIRSSTMLKTRNPSTIAAPAAKYSHSVEVPSHARWLFTAGQVGVRPDGSIPEGFEAQHDQIWQNTLAILADAGMGPEDIVRLNVYSTDPDGLKHVMAHRDKYLKPGHTPASTWVVVAGLANPKWVVEMETVAAKA